MFASSIYHQYGCMSEIYYFKLLKFDLMGIGIMIFGLCITATYIGFHNFETERNGIVAVMGFLMVINLTIQMTPCYAMEEYDGYRIAFYVLTLVICLGIALAHRFYFATGIEVD